MRRVLIDGLSILSVLAVATETALAGSIFPVPGPIAGAGAPALLAIAGAYGLFGTCENAGNKLQSYSGGAAGELPAAFFARRNS